MTSILTNNGAMVALQTLRGINNELGTVQEQISTGKKVGTAQDNASTWALSKVMEADVAGFNKISEGLAVSESTVAVARTAAESVTDLLTKIKDKIVQAQDPSQDQSMLQADIESFVTQIDDIVGGAQFNGVNLVDGGADLATMTGTNPVGAGTVGISVLSGMNRADGGAVTSSTIEVFAQDLSATVLTGATVTLDALNVDEAAGAAGDAATALTDIETMINTAVDVAASFGTAQNQLQTQGEFVSKLTDAMKSGIGAMVDADMEEASARLKALQTQQQLGVQSLSIANQAPQSVMALFR